MHILRESTRYFQANILPHIAKRHKKLFAFGYSSLTLTHFVSLNANARMSIPNRSTAESKIYRLVSNPKILTYFPLLLKRLELVQKGDRVNVDFSTFCGFQVLTFAKQTSLGRAIPLSVAAITYPIENPGSQTRFIIQEVKAFRELLGFPVHLVFDRGFALPYLAHYLVINHINFTIRMKKDKHVLYQGKTLPLGKLLGNENDCTVFIYETSLRVVRSEKKKGLVEPWYLLTNDTTSTRDKIITDYYFRFEIEETFKDLKHIYELNTFFTIQKKQTFLTLLWFYLLGLWIMWKIPQTQLFLTKRVAQNKHKRLSVTRHYYEQLQLFKSYQLPLPL
jgi:hypothetical protein